MRNYMIGLFEKKKESGTLHQFQINYGHLDIKEPRGKSDLEKYSYLPYASDGQYP